MKFSIESVAPAANRLSPALHVAGQIQLPGGVVLCAVSGRALAADGVVVGRLEEEQLASFSNTYASASQRRAGTVSATVHLVLDLAAAAVAYLEESRAKEKGDVVLNLQVWVRLLESPGTFLPAEWQPAQGAESGIMVRSTDLRKAHTILPVDSNQGFLTTQSEGPSEVVHRIPGSHWVRDFAPALGIGRRVVLELPEPGDLSGDPALHEALSEALAEVREAEQAMRSGPPEDALEALRKPMEIVRSRIDDIGSLLQRDGYTTDAVELFITEIRTRFELCSKFLHRVDKDRKRINPDLRAHREDAEDVYMATVSTLNRLAKKSRRHGAPR